MDALRLLLVLYFGSLDRNEKEKCINGTKKCSQYNMKMIMIDKLQQPNYECLNFFFVIGNMSICNPIVNLCYP